MMKPPLAFAVNHAKYTSQCAHVGGRSSPGTLHDMRAATKPNKSINFESARQHVSMHSTSRQEGWENQRRLLSFTGRSPDDPTLWQRAHTRTCGSSRPGRAAPVVLQRQTTHFAARVDTISPTSPTPRRCFRRNAMTLRKVESARITSSEPHASNLCWIEQVGCRGLREMRGPRRPRRS